MGVYVKGMKMPRSCYNCKLDLRTDICSAFLKWKKEHPYSIKGNDRLPDCPLVEVPEPHGQLIDADYLREHLYICETNGRPLHIMELDERLACIDEVPTVIEAEGE